jgi:hypothetical protein
MVISGCVSLPSETEQSKVLSRQNFDENYKFAITSHYQGAVISYKKSSISPIDGWDYLSKLSLEQAARGSDWIVLLRQGTQGEKESAEQASRNVSVFIASPDYITEQPVAIEKTIARSLRASLGVDTVYISRSDVRQKVKEWANPARGPMHGAKAIAAENNYDAVALVYFKPYFIFEKSYLDTKTRSLRQPYSVSFEAYFAARTVDKDQLIYSEKTTHHCDGSFSSESEVQIADTYDLIAKCEAQFHAAVIQKFILFVEKARSNQ